MGEIARRQEFRSDLHTYLCIPRRAWIFAVPMQLDVFLASVHWELLCVPQDKHSGNDWQLALS